MADVLLKVAGDTLDDVAGQDVTVLRGVVLETMEVRETEEGQKVRPSVFQGRHAAISARAEIPLGDAPGALGAGDQELVEGVPVAIQGAAYEGAAV